MAREQEAVEKTVRNAEGKKVVRRVRRVKKAVEPTTHLEDVVEETPVVVVEETPGGSRKRREITPDSVDAAFTELIESIDAEIIRQRDLKDKSGRAAQGGGIKFLRSTLKRAKQMQGDVRRVARKKRAVRQGNNNSGFMKKAAIADIMADFFGLEHGSRISRVDCTKALHAYILENNLQNPDNRREIRADKVLVKLLSYNKKSVEAGGHGPLYYYVMQKLIQQHFLKDEEGADQGDEFVYKDGAWVAA